MGPPPPGETCQAFRFRNDSDSRAVPFSKLNWSSSIKIVCVAKNSGTLTPEYFSKSLSQPLRADELDDEEYEKDAPDDGQDLNPDGLNIFHGLSPSAFVNRLFLKAGQKWPGRP
jgi:hypothetical protein